MTPEQDQLLREIYNRADWTNNRTVDMDTVLRDTFNRADWINEWRAEVDEQLAELKRLVEQLS